MQTEDDGIAHITHFLNTFGNSLPGNPLRDAVTVTLQLTQLPFQKSPFDIVVSSVGEDVLFCIQISAHHVFG